MRTARNCNDSGSATNISDRDDERHDAAENEHRTPAERRISQFATKPPIAAPSVKPIVMHMTHATRVRFGLNSPTSAVAFGMMRAEADAGDEPQPEHLLDVLRERRRYRHDGKEQRCTDEHRAAADLVGDHAEDERAEEYAEVADAQ